MIINLQSTVIYYALITDVLRAHCVCVPLLCTSFLLGIYSRLYQSNSTVLFRFFSFFLSIAFYIIFQYFSPLGRKCFSSYFPLNRDNSSLILLCLCSYLSPRCIKSQNWINENPKHVYLQITCFVLKVRLMVPNGLW